MFSHLTFDVPNCADGFPLGPIRSGSISIHLNPNVAVKGIIELIIMVHEAQESDRLP